MKIIFSLLVIKLALTYVSCEHKLHGVAPERLSLYDVNKPFTCLDGSGVMPFSQVNDDYCDCRDGSDEPGTSACLNGSFACENMGYIVQFIPSSRVNDGICDCCDGSDEYNRNANCENKCIVLAAKMREEEEKMKKLKEEGFVKRKELIEQGNVFKKTIQDRLDELSAQKLNVESERANLEAKKNEAEQKAKEAKEVQDKILEEKAKELSKIEMSRKAKLLFDLLDLDKDLFIKPEELLSRPELDILFDNDGTFTIEESIRLLDQNDRVGIELFATTYYEKISPHLKLDEVQKEEKKEEVQTNEEHENIEYPEGEHDHEHEHEHDHDHEHENEHEHEQEHIESEPQVVEVKTDSKYDQDTQRLIDESEEAKRSFEQTDKQFRDIEREINDAKKKLELDIGPNGEFASMIDKCFEYEDREYIYKLCPYHQTVQKSKSSHSETSIGNWKSWGEDGSGKYLTMVFENGLACWNGPQRSTRANVSCGTENKLIAVSEPNRCEYEMKFETPAVCDENQVVQEHIHDEI